MIFASRRRFLAAAALMFTLIPGASAAEPAKKRTVAAAEVWARTELYFGTNRSNGEVSDAEFTSFMDSEVTPRFPDGLTLLTGNGQFKNASGVIIGEKVHVLILLYPPQMQDANKKIQDLRELYKWTFQQESVLRIDSFSFVSF